MDKKNILYLFYRVGEPLYFPKGDLEQTYYFDLTPDYLTDQYKKKAPQILNRFNNEGIGRPIPIGPLLKNALLRIPLDQVQVVDRRDAFSLFIPRHQKAAGRLIRIFMELKTIEDLIAFAAYSHDRVNTQLYAYALSITLLHREDTKNLMLPSYAEIFPEKFINSEIIANAKETANIFDDPSDRTPIEISRNFTGNDSDPEHRLAYFREDLGINLHHWHWHLIYPFEGPDVMVKKDRRGELFYYLHQQMMARYNVERLCNSMNLAHRLLDWNKPIEEAYFPMLNTNVAGRDWPSRPAGMTLSNINRPDAQLRFDIEDLYRFKERIFEAIHRKTVIGADGKNISIDNDRGIDILGNIVEASTLTPNADYYGNIHNLGHLAIAYIHDPQYKYIQSPGVMSETTTAMRDPVFYRWHAFIDDIFFEHKNTLPAYDSKALNFPNVEFASFELCSFNESGACRPEKNVLNTFMMQSDINLSRGLDFTPRGSILVRVTHLNHEQFAYNLAINNKSNRILYGTVRIFIAPTMGYSNFTIDLNQQKRLMIEMDKFVVTLRPGRNKVVRQSTNSSLTIPFEQTFRNLDLNRPEDNQFEAFDRFNYCGCGWPQHMLVPKGTPGGYPMVAFAMVSDYSVDVVRSQDSSEGDCRTGISFCGLRDKKYPDKRPMGFPFDRPLPTGVDTLETFLTPNMAIRPITVVHSENVRNGNEMSRPRNVRDSNNVSGMERAT